MHSGRSQLLVLANSHRDLKTDEDRLTRGHAEKVQALEAQLPSLRKILKEATRDAEQKSLIQERRRVREYEAEQSGLLSQTVILRAQLAKATSETGQFRKELAEMEAKLQEAVKQAFKLATLRNLAGNGIEIEKGSPHSSPPAAARAAEWEENSLNACVSTGTHSENWHKLFEPGKMWTLKSACSLRSLTE